MRGGARIYTDRKTLYKATEWLWANYSKPPYNLYAPVVRVAARRGTHLQRPSLAIHVPFRNQISSGLFVKPKLMGLVLPEEATFSVLLISSTQKALPLFPAEKNECLESSLGEALPSKLAGSSGA